ncbi:MAG TPA: DUF4249 domain-containing protein [Bacteroidales bacterium]|nr:DUF4249 domain-containing protein [Bacteroidales bacterium]
MHDLYFRYIVFFAAFLVLVTCTTEFIPELREQNQMLVVEGLLTDQQETQTIKISRSLPIGRNIIKRPIHGCTVAISDDLNNIAFFYETDSGIYVSPEMFHGEAGRSYILHISAPDVSGTGIRNYESSPAILQPVPPIDSLYYEKTIVRDLEFPDFDIHTCQIYLDTYGSNSGYLRWEYFETWILRLLFSVPDQKCWVSDHSKEILIKNTTATGQTYIKKQPVIYISNKTDRLQTKYSILVNQYSMNEDEYNYWAALKTLSDGSGGLYDVIPAAVPGNIRCIEDSSETVLGYFSVSAKSSKRIFIDEIFRGIINQYSNCITDTVYGDVPIRGIDTTVWVLFDRPAATPIPRRRILTSTWGCYSCTARGTKERPSFWIGE